MATTPPRRSTARERGDRPVRVGELHPRARRASTRQNAGSIQRTLRAGAWSTTRSSTRPARHGAHAARSQFPVCDAATIDPPPPPQHLLPPRERGVVEAHAVERATTPEHHPEELHRARAERRVHRARLGRRPRDPGPPHRVLDVPPPDAQHAPGEPPQDGTDDTQRLAGQKPDESGEAAEERRRHPRLRQLPKPGAPDDLARGGLALHRHRVDVLPREGEELPLGVARKHELPVVLGESASMRDTVILDAVVRDVQGDGRVSFGQGPASRPCRPWRPLL